MNELMPPVTVREKVFPTLWRKNENGNLGFWDTWTVNNHIFTRWGIVGGAEQESSKEITRWTNEGKSNERDPIAQAQFEAEALWKKRKDNGYHLSRKIAMDETRRISAHGGIKPMKAQAFINIKGKSYEHKIKYPCYVQPKLNGVRVIATIEGYKTQLWSSGGKEYHSCNPIKEDLKDLFPDHIIPDGEVYKHGWPLQKISGLTRRINCHSMEDHALEYHIFDIVDFENPFEARLMKLREYECELASACYPNIRIVPTELVTCKEEAEYWYKHWVAQGYEGMIYRNMHLMYKQKRSMDMIKRKEFHDGEFEIISYTEGVGKLVGCLASFRCKTLDGGEFDAPMVGTHEYLRSLWKERDNFIGKDLTVQFLEYSAEGIPQNIKGLKNGIHVRPKGE